MLEEPSSRPETNYKRSCRFSLAAGNIPLDCCRCAHKRRASPLTCLAIFILVLGYSMLGGFLFYAIEGGHIQRAEETSVAASKPDLGRSRGAGPDLRSRTVERLWSITEDLNILYKENWTKLAAKELMDFQKVLIKSIRGGTLVESEPLDHDAAVGLRWTLAGSVLYALTLITTIGHGHVTPKSSVGKVVAIAYACVGIPIIMLYLSTIGEALARNFRVLYSRLRPSRIKRGNFHTKTDCLGRYTYTGHNCKRRSAEHREERSELDIYERSGGRTPFQAALNLDGFRGGYHWTCRDHTRVPIALSLLLIALYIALGTFVFHETERWNYIDGCFFSFSSLATVGFGQLRPGLYGGTVSPKAEDVAVGVCCVYILVGILVIAMCFNLIQEELSAGLRRLTSLSVGGSRARAVHSAERAPASSVS